MTKLVLPNFNKTPEQHLQDTVGAIRALDKAIASLLTIEKPTWENFGKHISLADNHAAAAGSTLQAVYEMNYTDETIEVFNRFLAFSTKREAAYAKNKKYQQAIRALSKTRLTKDQRKWMKIMLEEIDQYDIKPKDRNRLLAIEEELEYLTNNFNNHFQQSLQNWRLYIEDESHLAGLRQELIDRFKKVAEEEGKDGWVVTLSESIWGEIITTAENRNLRRAVHFAYNTIGSDLHPTLENNMETIDKILRLRNEMAVLLGHKTFAEYATSNMNVTDPNRIIRLFKRLDRHVDAKVKEERAEAAAWCGHEVADHDVMYYLEDRQAHTVGDTCIREYLNTEATFYRMLEYFSPIFGLEFRETDPATRLHNLEKFFEVYKDGTLIGGFYTELFERKNRIDMCAVGNLVATSEDRLPIYLYMLACEDTMTHGDLVVMLHEFGHLIHGLMNRCPFIQIGGYESLRLDAVEFMSQFMENFAWHKPTMKALCKHHQTNNEPSNETLDRIIADRKTRSGTFLQDYIKRSLADLIMHNEYKDVVGFAPKVMIDVLRYNGIPYEEWHSRVLARFHHTFGSVAGYESAYYIYIWSELFARDAFEMFAGKRSQNSIAKEMERFVECFLVPTRENFLKQFKDYMGRSMSEKAWFDFYGID
jgi:oligopeptidase A